MIKKFKSLKAGDVETNPGPADLRRDGQPETKLILVTQNCRGLADERKVKHLLNNCHKLGRTSTDFVVALQETMVTNDQKIKYGWRGNHIFTPGTNHGKGCITLLPSHIQPDLDNIIHLDLRGHIFKATIGQNTAVIANMTPLQVNRERKLISLKE